MTLIAIVSPGDAPGATTTALALTLTWPTEPALLAECSAAGGHVLRGYFQCPTQDRGLWQLGMAAARGIEYALHALSDHVIAIDERGGKQLLPGLPDPFTARELTNRTWQTLVSMLKGLPSTVLADAGAIDPQLPLPLLQAADLVLVVMRPTLAQVTAAKIRVDRLRAMLNAQVPVGLCLIGQRPHTQEEVRAQLGEFAVVVSLPNDDRSAKVLSDGGSQREIRRLTTGRLLLDARMTARVLFNRHGHSRV